LLQAGRDGFDPSRSSFDGLRRAELAAGLADLGIPADGAHVRSEVAGTAAIASFHERLWRLGQTSAAFTCVEQVARRLTTVGVPVVRLRPTDLAISSALQVATLLAWLQVLTDSQLAVVAVEVPALRANSRRPAPRQASEELQLTVHRFLVREAQRIQATVSRAGDHGFLVLATRASLASAGDPPFAARARAALGIVLDVGVGVGRSEHEAEARARQALGQAGPTGADSAAAPARQQAGLPGMRSGQRGPGGQPVMTGRGGAGRTGQRGPGRPGGGGPGGPGGGGGPGRNGGNGGGEAGGPGEAGRGGAGGHPGEAAAPPRRAVPGTGRGRPPAGGFGPATAATRSVSASPAGSMRRPGDSLSRLRALETLSRLAQRLAADAAPVVDAELTGQLLSVTPRTARRQLRTLVDEGLALPLPPARRQHPGRPRLAYRLVVEKLDRRAVQ
jgi:hypothetical protein